MIWFLGLLAAVGALLFGITVLGTKRINSRYRSTGTRVDVDGVVVHAVVRGTPSAKRPSLVFVHGASSNHREFMIALDGQSEGRLPPDQHMIFVDRPGQGGSARVRGDHSPKVQALRIMRAAHQLGAKSVIAIGHSWGGAVVAQMGVHGDDIDSCQDASRDASGEGFVRGVVFCAPATHPWPGDRFQGVDWFYAVADTPIIGWLCTRLITLPVAWSQIDEGVENVFSPEPPKPGYATALGPRLLLRPASFRANAEDVHRLRKFVIANAPAYAGITCPVHIITGDEDGVVWPSIHCDGLERDIDGAKKSVITGGGHMPHQTHTELLLDAIEDVMERAQTRA